MKRKKSGKYEIYTFHVKMGDRGKVFTLALTKEQAEGVGILAKEVNFLSHPRSELTIDATPDLPTKKNKV